MTIAGSTFYGLSASQSATDMSSSLNNQDMGDYRHATDSLSNRRLDDLQSFVTLEEFMSSEQDEDEQCTINRSISPRATPQLSDYVHIQHKNLNDIATYSEQIRQLGDTSQKNDIGSLYNKTSNETLNNSSTYVHLRNKNTHARITRQLSEDNFIIVRSEGKGDCANDKSCSKCMSVAQKRIWNSCSSAEKKRMQELTNAQKTKYGDSTHWKNVTNPRKQDFPGHSKDYYEHNTHVESSNHDSYKAHDYLPSKDVDTLIEDSRVVQKRLVRNDADYSESSSDLASHALLETQQCTKKDVLINRKGSFNFMNRHDFNSSDKHWLDSLKRGDKRGSNCDKIRLKNVAQYQPPPIPTSPFEQEGMRAAFEMHLDKGDQVQKASRLKSLFGSKQQKPCTLDLPKDNGQKTILGSPRLHRALFRDKCGSNQSQHRSSACSGSQSPGDSGISQSHSSFSGNSPSHTLSQSFSSVSSISDYSPDASIPSNISKYGSGGYSSNRKGFSNSGRGTLAPPTLPYIPPPTSPPPDYPGLEYPPVFEPGTYSLSDASLLRNRSKSNQNTA